MIIKKKGFTLLEVIFAVAILGMVIVMIYPSMTSSFDLFRRAKDIDIVNSKATNKLEEFKKNPVEYWKNISLNPSAKVYKYDKDNKIIGDNELRPVYYYKYTYGDDNNDGKGEKFYYFDNEFNPVTNEKDAIYKINMWGYRKKFSNTTNNVIPQSDVTIKNISLNQGNNYFEAYEIFNHGPYNKPYDLGYVLGKDATWVDWFLSGSADSNTLKKTYSGNRYENYVNKFAKASGRKESYYYNLRNGGESNFRHWFYRLYELRPNSGTSYAQADYPIRQGTTSAANFDYPVENKDYIINAIINVSNLKLDEKVEIDFANKLKNPIELYLVYNAEQFSNMESSKVLELMQKNITLNVLDNDVNMTFISNESISKDEYELILDVYRIDKRTNTEKKYDTFRTKVLI